MEGFTGWPHAVSTVPCTAGVLRDTWHLGDLKPTSMDLHATRSDYTLASQMCWGKCDSDLTPAWKERCHWLLQSTWSGNNACTGGSAHQWQVTGVVDGGLSPFHVGLWRLGSCSGRLGWVELLSFALCHDIMLECDKQMRSLYWFPSNHILFSGGTWGSWSSPWSV